MHLLRKICTGLWNHITIIWHPREVVLRNGQVTEDDFKISYAYDVGGNFFNKPLSYDYFIRVIQIIETDQEHDFSRALMQEVERRVNKFVLSCCLIHIK
jgi:hypothetical protein